MNILQMAAQLKNNPGALSQMLYQNGKINQQQFNDIKGKSPSEIGEYLMNNNLIPNIDSLKKQALKFMK